MYLFLLGRNFLLSRAELLKFSTEVFCEEQEKLILVKNLQGRNPRNLPKSKEQIFLDRLGGSIRMAEKIGKHGTREKIIREIFEQVYAKREAKIKIGISAFGTSKNFLAEFIKKTREFFSDKKVPLRIENTGQRNLSSGEIFQRKLLKKGAEFIILSKDNQFLLFKTASNQNLRNYAWRDFRKPFRDSQMGMLPPKLAQIMINLAEPQAEENIIDPFCGSGTIAAEAALMGFRSLNSDISKVNIEGAQKNFEFLAQKFRFPESWGRFVAQDATEISWDKTKGTIVTEGILGHNFTTVATELEATKNGDQALQMWQKFFANLADSKIRKVLLCLPVWNLRNGQQISIAGKLFLLIKKHGFTPAKFLNGEKSLLYSRPRAFVGREICRVEKR